MIQQSSTVFGQNILSWIHSCRFGFDMSWLELFLSNLVSTHSLKLTARTWKLMVGRRFFPLGRAYVQGLLLSFKEGSWRLVMDLFRKFMKPSPPPSSLPSRVFDQVCLPCAKENAPKLHRGSQNMFFTLEKPEPPSNMDLYIYIAYIYIYI